MARNRRKNKGGSDRATGIVLFVIGIILLVALGGGAWWLKKTKIKLDADNCPQTGPRAIDVIMIDRSDPISGQQAQRIRQYVQAMKDEAAFGTRFDVYTFEGDIKNEFPPILRVCAPGRPEEANELIENPEFIRQRYNERFLAVLNQTIDALLIATTLPNSPIIESLRAAAITSFGSNDSRHVPLRVLLISDMVQHTNSVSHFRSNPDFPTLSKTMTWATIRPNLHGADVEILYLLRPNATRAHVPIQNRSHQLFWEQLISASNGRLMKIEPL